MYYLQSDDEELDAEGVIDPGMEYIPPPSMPLATGTIMVRKKIRPAELIKQELESEDEERGRDGEEDEGQDEGLLPAGRGRGIERRKVLQEKGEGCVSLPTPRYTFISLYEERMLLHRLEACPQALAVTPQAKRLHRKLLVRQAKRERGLPLLDVDQAVSATLSLVGGVYGAQGGLASHRTSGEEKYRTTSQDLRILDRFQVSQKNTCIVCIVTSIEACLKSVCCFVPQSTVTVRKGFYQPTVSFWHRLMGSDACMDQTIKSPYTSRVLKPYIRYTF